MREHLKRNWKRYAGLLAVAGASYYGGPAGVAALKALGSAIGW